MNNYDDLIKIIPHLLESERNFITNAANFSAIIFEKFTDLNWVGFYIYNGKELVLGPFQGKVACVRIALGKGVCGTAANEKKSIVVEDVDKFPGHIACDSASRSELVIPIFNGYELYGVFDMDSPVLNRFNNNDKIGFEKLIDVFIQNTDLQDLRAIFK